jgi:biotin carboxyl carrier protein
MDSDRTFRQSPDEECAAVDRTLKPFRISCVKIEKDRDRLVLFASILANLEFTRVRGCPPVDMPGRFVGNIRPDAIEIVTPATLMGLQVPRDSGQQEFEAGLRIDGRIHKNLLFEAHMRPAVRKPEREARGEPERLVLVLAAPLEVHWRRFGNRHPCGNQRNIQILAETGLRSAAKMQGEGRCQKLAIADFDDCGSLSAGDDVCGQLNVKFEPSQSQTTYKSGNQQSRQQGREQQEQQIIAGNEGGKTHQDNRQRKHKSDGRDLLAHAFLERFTNAPPDLTHGRRSHHATMFASMSSFVRNVRVNGRELSVRVEQDGCRWRIDAGNGVREASVIETEPGVYSILIDGQSFEVRASELNVEIEDPRELRKSGAVAGLEGRQTVSAPMPGKVVRVLVAEGDIVGHGQGLVVIEAMKMQNEMKSPKPGTVISLTAIEGAAVAAGQVLAVVE